MTVLVTGATGSLGQAVIRRLLAEGQSVAVLTRRPFRAAALYGSAVTVHEWHPLSEQIPREALAGVDGVLHLMGEPFSGRPSHDRAALVRDSRLNATRRLIEALKARGAPVRLVSASIATLPPGDGVDGPPLDDRALPPPSAGDAAGKTEDAPWEALTLAAAADGLSVAVVRLGLLAAEAPPLMALVALARKGLVPDLRGAQIPAIDPDDAAAMLSGLVQRSDLAGVIHGLAPEPIPGEALAKALARLSPLPIAVPLPLRLVRQQLGRIGPLLAGRRRFVPGRLVEAGAQFTHPDPLASVERALEAIAASAAKRQPLLHGLRRPRPAEPA